MLGFLPALLPASTILPKAVTFYIGMMVIGFLIAIWGHAARSRFAVTLGIALIFLATVIFPIAINLTGEEPPPPGPGIHSPGE